MKKSRTIRLTLITIVLFSMTSLSAVEVGSMAPDFSLPGHPKTVSLEELRGKYTVLEWYNNGCPFVRKHYDSKNIPNMQKKYKGKVQWITLNSSAEGKQGYIENTAKAAELYTQDTMSSMALLIDSDGKVGQNYQAKTTPHFFVIDPKGKIVYQGAIDSIASPDSADISKAENYVSMALDQALAGKEITTSKTRPYGCSVKY
jgi:peroxiredoxin